MPIDVVDVSTTDPEQAHQAINEAFLAERPATFSTVGDDFRFHLKAMQAGPLLAGRYSHNQATQVVTEPFHDFWTIILFDGQVDWEIGRDRFSQRPDEVLLYPGGVALRPAWNMVDVGVVNVPLAAIDDFARAHVDGTSHPVTFNPTAPLSPAAGRQWATLMRYTLSEFGAPDSIMNHPLVLAHMVEMIAATALTVFPNTAMTADYLPGPGQVGAASLRRAVDYIDSHAADPVTLSDIAQAAGTSGRAMQAAFHRHYGLTPMAYLRQVRLERAHHDLQAADPNSGVTVAQIAARWGFTSGARFTAFYRERFGQPPSQTLRN